TAAHFVTASAGGTLNFGATSRNIAVLDNAPPGDPTAGTAAIAGSGGVTKTGAGTLTLNNATVTAPLTIGAGTLATGTAGSVGSATIGSLAFNAGTTLRMKV